MGHNEDIVTFFSEAIASPSCFNGFKIHNKRSINYKWLKVGKIFWCLGVVNIVRNASCCVFTNFKYGSKDHQRVSDEDGATKGGRLKLIWAFNKARFILGL